MYTRIVNYKNALTCKVVILKKVIAETSIQNGGLLYDYLSKWHHDVKGLPCDYPICIGLVTQLNGSALGVLKHHCITKRIRELLIGNLRFLIYNLLKQLLYYTV